jgi:pentatricopeptide repeat protein
MVYTGQWQLALNIFKSMEHHGLKPNTLNFNAVIDACGSSGQWQKAMELFHSMDDDEYKVERDVVTYSVAINACVGGERNFVYKAKKRKKLRTTIVIIIIIKLFIFFFAASIFYFFNF